MRRSLLSFIAVAALMACNPATQTTDTGGGAPGGFPSFNTASYRAEATMREPDSGRTMQIVQYRAGESVRMETPVSITILNGATREAFLITDMSGQKMAMRMPFDDMNLATQAWQADPTAFTRGGPCSVAGENGTEWSRLDEDGAPGVACITSDGIMLRGTENGQIVWETTSLVRGAQDAALFAPPAGVEPLDMGAMMGAKAP